MGPNGQSLHFTGGIAARHYFHACAERTEIVDTTKIKLRDEGKRFALWANLSYSGYGPVTEELPVIRTCVNKGCPGWLISRNATRWVETNGQATVLILRDGVPIGLTIDASAQGINEIM
jgi:hypothetical protein